MIFTIVLNVIKRKSLEGDFQNQEIIHRTLLWEVISIIIVLTLISYMY